MIDFNTKNPVASITKILEKAENKIKQAENGKNWNEVFSPIDDIEAQLNKKNSIYSHLNSVCFNEEFNTEYEKVLTLVNNFYTSLGTNKKLYQAFKQLNKDNLNKKQVYILNNVLYDFKLSGVTLNGEDKKKFKKLSNELVILGNNFTKNSIQATNSYKEEIAKLELSGLDDNYLNKLEENGKYFLSLQIPQYLAVMSYCDNREIREKLYNKYIIKASEFDNFDNKKIIDKILIKRKELAKLLGFANYTQYSLANKMVKAEEDVQSFLNNLIQESLTQAKYELSKLNEFANFSLKPWDLQYYSEKLKQQQFGINKSEIAKYFPFKQVLSGLIELIEEMYNLKIQQKTIDTYGEKIVILEFIGVGEIYLDAFARKNKRDGAWMSDYCGLSEDTKPIAFVICNATKPTTKIPSLLEFDDVITLFHEFGHALHHLLTEVKYPSVAGISGVPWDGVELPSQYMELFAYEKQVISKISSHYKTKKPLPDDLYDKLIASKNFNSALAMLRQCEFAMWDINTHISDDDTYEVLKQVQQQTSLLEPSTNNRFLNTFGHIFNGGYAAGYYSYKWAEVMAADAYEVIKKDKNKINDFRKYILATGGESDFMQNYIKFSGTKPNIKSLLKMNNINNN